MRYLAATAAAFRKRITVVLVPDSRGTMKQVQVPVFTLCVGAVLFLVTVAMSLWALYSKLAGQVLPGWTSTVLPIYFIGGIQIMCI